MEPVTLTHDNPYIFSGHFEEKYLFSRLVDLFGKEIPADREAAFLCIGIDRSAGDCFGPMTGTLLKQMRVPNVLGTLEEPVHAGNIMRIHDGMVKSKHFLVAIDASLGAAGEVGFLKVKRGPLTPASAMGRDLTPVGDLSVVLNVSVGGIANYLLLQSASVNLVWKGANVLARAIFTALYARRKVSSPLTSKTLVLV